MTISSSLNAGVAGLASNATRLAAISDNIANSSTYGYKRVEADFHSMVVSQQGGKYSAGGVRVSTQRMIDQGGSLITTNNPTDIAVRGRGMLPVANSAEVLSGNGTEQMLLTTTGSFRTDSDGYLVTQSGLMLLGWPSAADGSMPTYPRDTADGLEPIQVKLNQLIGEPTTRMSLGVNLPATDTQAGAPGDPHELSVEYFDNLGKSENITVGFSPTVPGTGSSNEWTMTLEDSTQPGVIIGEYTLTFDDSRTGGGTLASVATISGGAYDANSGQLIVNVGSGPIEINVGIPGQKDGLTQLSDGFAPVGVTKDGSPVGNMVSVEIDDTGSVYALFDTGVSRRIYQVPMVDLPNPNGMISLDFQTFMPSPDSGPFFLWDAGTGPTGSIASFAREESTVDVAGELTSLIQTQRAYSSNAKVIQTVDEMLQETTNIKR